MKIFTLASEKINNLTKNISFLLMIFMTIIIVLQVFYRYVVGSSLSWSEETARYMFIWIVMLGASMGVKEGFHVAVTIIKDRLPGKVKLFSEISISILLGVMALAMIIFGHELAKSVAIQLSPAIRVSMYWVYLSVPTSGVIIIIHLLSKIEQNIVKLNSTNEGSKENWVQH